MNQLVARAAEEARGAMERVLAAMGWPPEEHTLSLAVDRLLELEEAGRRERADAIFEHAERGFLFGRHYWRHRRLGMNCSEAARSAAEATAAELDQGRRS